MIKIIQRFTVKKTWFIYFIEVKNLENGLSLPMVITHCSDFQYNKENVLSSHSLEYGIVVENVDKGDSGKGARLSKKPLV